MELDDIMNEIFGDEKAKAEEPSVPKEEAKEVAFEDVPKEETPKQSEPEKPVFEKNEQSGEYRYVPPKQPEEQRQPYQQAPNYGSYYAPPVYNQGAPVMNGAPLTPQKPKKMKRAVKVIIAIAVICGIISFAGVIGAGKLGKISDDSPLSSFGQNDEEKEEETEESGDNSGAEVVVQDSDEAEKKDSKGNLTAAGVVEKAKDSCVGITVYTEQNAYSYFYNYGQSGNNDGKTATGEGSGVIMSEANGKTYIMTCAHVIADGSSFTVTLDNDKEYEATMVGYDSQTDIGVLSINATGLSVAEFGNSKDIEVGEDCIAIGCPGGLTFKNSVTRGIVSALDVPVSSSIGYNNECIQVDAAINPGNSGGALFNMQGQVIGINSSKIASTEYEGMGFAVPSNTAVETANSLIKNGYVAGRAKIGIQYNTLENYNSASSILSALADKGYENADGTMVIQVIDAESDLNGKVQQYDMIVAVNGETLTSVDVLTSVLSGSEPGDTIKLTIARIDGNKINTFDVDCKLVESKQ